MQADAVGNLAAAMRQVAATMHAPLDLDAALRQITATAVDSIPGVDYASISVTKADGTISTLAATAPLAEQVDRIQYDVQEGPCLDAVLDELVVVVEDLTTDVRWPAYAPLASDLGLRSQVAFQFRAHHDQVCGALNLYAITPGAIDAQLVHLGGLLAEQAAVATGWDHHQENLQKAIASREQIGIAVGIVMHRYRLTPERAFDFLVRTSQAANTKLRDVARGIIDQTAGGAL